MRILICGSRDANNKLLSMASKFITTMADKGTLEVVCGDADGIDRAVITTCDVLGITIDVYGALNRFRNETKTGKNHRVPVSYTERDQHMVDLKPDCVVGFWNGVSHGTPAVVRYAKSKGIEAYLVK